MKERGSGLAHQSYQRSHQRARQRSRLSRRRHFFRRQPFSSRTQNEGHFPALLPKISLKPSASKVAIDANDTDSLCQVISPVGIKPNAGEVEYLKTTHMSYDATQTRSLIGNAGYYRTLYRNLTRRIRPLNGLLKQGV